MTSQELRQKFLNFFAKKGHKIVPSSSLIPADPSVLFTSAGMQQFVPYLIGEKDVLKDFGTRHLISCQKCFRSNDIEEVGDDTHNTFFEMLGNWSIGQDPKRGYFKEGAIKYALEFFINTLGLDKDRFWVTIFKGEKNIPKDEESKKIWQENGIPEERIKEFGLEDNFWGPTGITGPCGPNSEIHYDRGKELGCGNPDCGPNCLHCQRFVELWNLVFMEYFKNESGEYQFLPQKNVDTGIGFERLIAVLEKRFSAYETDLFWPIIQELERTSSKKYNKEKRNFRILADHIRGAIFLISEGILPSNVERGYVLRRILRRAIRYGKLLNLPKNFLIPLAQKVVEIYKDVYPEVKSKETDILTIIQNEEEKFERTLEKGLRESFSWWDKVTMPHEIKPGDKITYFSTKDAKELGKKFFDLFQNYGFPLELSLEELKNHQKTEEVLEEEIVSSFNEELKKHQEISRAGVEGKFGGVGEGATYESAKLHTATHLLHAALRQILGSHVKQMGSDVTPQRLRFDFSHPQKMTEEELKKVENIVNQKIKEDLEVKKEEMSYQEAIKSGALALVKEDKSSFPPSFPLRGNSVFKKKYPEKVTVYSITELPKEAKVKKRTKSSSPPKVFSKEICAGPHVKRTSELGRHFEILKEESSGAGVRRIRAILK